jgi:energy-coupling factor transporter ATP-binding protein EcfA2
MVKARDEWHERWLAVPRLGVPPPIFVVAHPLPAERPTHEVVTFQIPPGADFASYDRHAGHLAAALGSDTVLVAAMAAYDDTGRPIPGSQQALGFQVIYSLVPLGKAPHLRCGLDSFTQRFVIRHAFKGAFTALKLGSPELASVTSLAADESQLLVEAQWKLSPGVVAEDVMAKAKAVAEKVGAPFVSVGRRSTGEGSEERDSEFISVVFGDRPEGVRLASPVATTQRFLDRIRWDGWFWSCGLRGAGGQTPRFLDSQPAHQGLLVSEFAATEGLPWESVEKATPALIPTVGQAYVEVEASDKAGGFRIVTGAVDPLDRSYLFMDYADELLLPPGDRPDVTFFVGVGVDGKPVLFDHEHEQPHVVVAGASGMGKSTLIHSMVGQLAHKNTPDQWELWIAEPKNELQRYKRLPHVKRFIDLSTRGFDSHYEALAAMLTELEAEMERRYALFDTLPGRPKKLSAARGLTDEPLPFITVLVEECADFFFEPHMKEINGAAWKAVLFLADKLARKARGAGIYLVFATQRPTKVSIPPNIKGQSRRIGFGCSTLVDSMVVIDQPGLETIRTRGRGMISGIKGYRGFRAFWLRQPDEENPEEPDDIEQILGQLDLMDEDRILAPGGARVASGAPPAIPSGIWGDDF